jgi:hypothetical protein
MIIDTHTHVVSSDKVKHPLDPGARGWSTEVSNDVEELIAEMDRAGVACATWRAFDCGGARRHWLRSGTEPWIPLPQGGLPVPI